MSVIVKPRLINFFGEPIAVVETEIEINGQLEPMLGVVARRLVEQLGLEWARQLTKLRDDAFNRFNAFEGKAEGPDGKMYTSTILPLTSVNAFLFTINPNKMDPSDVVTTTLADGSTFKESKQQKLIRYQNECQMVLHDYWIHGAAMNFRAEPHELESQKTYDILQTSRKRFNNMFNNLVSTVIDNKGLRGQEFEDAVKEFTNVLEVEVRDAIMLCMDAKELDFDKGLIRKLGEPGLREISGMEAMHVSILENCVCDLISQFRRKEIGDGIDYSIILEILPEYFSSYLENVGKQVLTMRSTFNRGKGLFVQ